MKPLYIICYKEPTKSINLSNLTSWTTSLLLPPASCVSLSRMRLLLALTSPCCNTKKQYQDPQIHDLSCIYSLALRKHEAFHCVLSISYFSSDGRHLFRLPLDSLIFWVDFWTMNILFSFLFFFYIYQLFFIIVWYLIIIRNTSCYRRMFCNAMDRESIFNIGF